MIFRKIHLAILIAIMSLAADSAHAQLSLLMTFSSDASGISLGGLGLGSASISFGSVSAFGGSVPSGVTKTTNTNTWTLSTPFDITVTGVGIVNPTYTLTAKLHNADAVNTWKIGSTTLSSGGFSTLSTSSPYLTTIPWTLNLTIPFSASPGAINNTIDFVATGN